jgi:hypothetical protein
VKKFANDIQKRPAVDQITISSFPRFIRLFFMTFFSAGIFSVIGMLCGIGNITVGSENGPSRPATPGDAWGPGIFVLIGLAGLLVRYRIYFDAPSRSIRKIVGWAIWTNRSHHSLSEATLVDVGPAEQRGDGSGRYRVVPVKVMKPEGAVEIAEPSSFSEARHLAMSIARALHLPMGPGLTGSQQEKSAEDDDNPVTTNANISLEDLRPPNGTTITVRELDPGIEIQYPMTKAALLWARFFYSVAWICIGCLWWFFWIPMAQPHNDESWLMRCIYWFPIWVGIIGGLMNLLIAYRHGSVGRFIRVDGAGRVRASGRTVDGSRIRALEILPVESSRYCLEIILDHGEFTTCPGLSEAELRYVRAKIMYHLCLTLK